MQEATIQSEQDPRSEFIPILRERLAAEGHGVWWEEFMVVGPLNKDTAVGVLWHWVRWMKTGQTMEKTRWNGKRARMTLEGKEEDNSKRAEKCSNNLNK